MDEENSATIDEQKLCKSESEYGYLVMLPLDIPISSILQIKNNNLDAHFKLIYNKYICHNAPLMINISYLQKKQITENITNISKISDNINKIKIYDAALKSIHQLLLQSFCRYKIDFKDRNSRSIDLTATSIPLDV